MKFTYKDTGLQQLVQRVQRFPKKLATKTLKKVGTEASKPISSAMKQTAPVVTKTWRKSVGRKVKLYKGGKLVVWIVGPRSKYIAQVTLQKAPAGLQIRQTAQGQFVFWRRPDGSIRRMPVVQKRRPVMYTHRIEPKNHNIRRAMNQSRAASKAGIARVLTEGVREV